MAKGSESEREREFYREKERETNWKKRREKARGGI